MKTGDSTRGQKIPAIMTINYILSARKSIIATDDILSTRKDEEKKDQLIGKIPMALLDQR